MGLLYLFDQRPVGPTHGSIPAQIPLTKPSGPQSTESELETALVEQLDYTARVHDILTQPGIRYRKNGQERRYTADVFVELLPDEAGSWTYFLVEVKPAKRLEKWRRDNAEKIKVAHAWCAQHRAQYRIVTEREIQTPFLANARTLKPSVGTYPDAEALAAIRSIIGTEPARLGDIVASLCSKGHEEAAVRCAMDQAVANRFLRCDLSKPYDDGSLIRDCDPTGRQRNDEDPIIRLLMRADSV